MKSWIQFEHGMLIGFKDKNGQDLAIGDKVLLERTVYLPNEDGWGREVRTDKQTNQSQKIEWTGTIMYFPERGEFRIKDDHTSNTWNVYENDLYKREM
jgi:hypothetical protein